MRPSRYGVHPRVGGGDMPSSFDSAWGSGPSPRGRGRHVLPYDPCDILGSIPAWAGETRKNSAHRRTRWVHPRVGGGDITPQEVAVGDALRGAKMFERVGVPVIGIVENMSYFESPETGKPMAIFGTGGGRRLADELKVPLLGEIPLYPPVLEGGDRGTPIVVSDASSSAARRLSEIAMSIAESFVW